MTETRDDTRAPDPDLPAPPPRATDQTVWVGLFLVLGLASTLAALLVLTDAAIFRGRYIVTTHVKNAGGIRRGDPVQMRGVNIGRVMGFHIQQDGVDVRLEIEGEYEVPDDSKVQLISAGLLGGLIAEVVPGQSQKVLHYGDRVAGTTAEQLSETTNRLTDKTDKVLAQIDALLAPETIDNVKGSTGELRKLLGELKGTVNDQRGELKTLVASLRKSAEGLERVATAPEVERAAKRLDALTERLDKTGATLDRSAASLESVMSRMDRGEGTLGKLSKDTELYDNLNRAALKLNDTLESTRKLADDLKANPKRYFKVSVF